MSAAQYAREALERAAKATEGDWFVETMPETGESRIGTEVDGFAFMAATTVTKFPVPGGVTQSDAEFIAAARSDVPKLARAVLAVLEVCEARDVDDPWNTARGLATTDSIRRALSDALEEAAHGE